MDSPVMPPHRAPTIAPHIEMGNTLSVLAVTPQMVAVNKPAGLHSAPLQTNETSTVLNAVVALYPECAQPVGKKPMEGTLVHRLDRGTSGVLVFARSAQSYQELRHLWTMRTISKDYLAWVDGPCSANGTIALNLAHSPKSKKRMIVVPSNQLKKFKYWEAISSIQPLFVGAQSLVLIRIHTGVTHQIRATLAVLGHAVLEDPIYKSANKPLGADMLLPFEKTLKVQIKSIQKNIQKSFNDSHKPWPPQPHRELLPEHGFFLHAHRLQSESEGIASLNQGVEAPPPAWFGWLPP